MAKIMLGATPKPVQIPRDVCLIIRSVDEFCASMRRINILSSEYLGSTWAPHTGRALRKELRFVDRFVKNRLASEKRVTPAQLEKLHSLPPVALIGPSNLQRKRSPKRKAKPRAKAKR